LDFFLVSFFLFVKASWLPFCLPFSLQPYVFFPGDFEHLRYVIVVDFLSFFGLRSFDHEFCINLLFCFPPPNATKNSTNLFLHFGMWFLILISPPQSSAFPSIRFCFQDNSTLAFGGFVFGPARPQFFLGLGQSPLPSPFCFFFL